MSYLDCVRPPDSYPVGQASVFLAGGITGCPDWQQDALQLVREAGIEWAVLNPRRIPTVELDSAAQVAWEFRHLRLATAILFWFPASTSPQPIALYELGAHATGSKPLAVGADPGYPRRLDVVLQLSHIRPGLTVRNTLEDVVADLADVCRNRTGKEG